VGVPTRSSAAPVSVSNLESPAPTRISPFASAVAISSKRIASPSPCQTIGPMGRFELLEHSESREVRSRLFVELHRSHR
jgi:hypothetical protein